MSANRAGCQINANKVWEYYLAVTRECDIRCAHCYSTNDQCSAKGQRNMSSERFVSIGSGIAKHMDRIGYGLCNIRIMGGEPTIMGVDFYKETMPSLRAALDASQSAFKTNIALITNLASQRSVNVASLPYFDQVVTSYEPGGVRFNSARMEAHWLENIRELSARGIKVIVGCTLCRSTIQYGAKRLLDWYYENGIKHVHFSFYVPGEVQSMAEKRNEKRHALLQPTFREITDFYIEVAKWYFERRDYDPDLFIAPAETTLRSIQYGQSDADLACPKATGSLHIEWDGLTGQCSSEVCDGILLTGNVFSIDTGGVDGICGSPEFVRMMRKSAHMPMACYRCPVIDQCQTPCHILMRNWEPEVDDGCPGYKEYIMFVRDLYYQQGLRARVGSKW